MLKPGTYRLTQDVKNPKPDRRKTDNWTAKPTFKAGKIFVVIGADDETRRTVKCVGESHYDRIPAHDDRAIAMEPHLEPIEETIDAMFLRLAVHLWHLPSFLRYLIESGVITREQFEQHLSGWLSPDDDLPESPKEEKAGVSSTPDVT